MLNFRAVNQAAVNLEISRLAEAMAAGRLQVAGDLGNARRFSATSSGASSKYASLEADSRSPEISNDRQKLQALANRIEQFVADGIAQEERIAQQARIEADQLRAENERRRVAEAELARLDAERLKLAQSERIRISALQNKLALIQHSITELPLEKMPTDLRDEGSALKSEALAVLPATSDEATLQILGSRLDVLSRKFSDYRTRQDLTDEITSLKKFIDGSKSATSDASLLAQIDDASLSASLSSPILSIEQLRNNLQKVRAAEQAIKDFEQLAEVRSNIVARLNFIKGQLDQTSGEFDGMNDMRAQLTAVQQKLDRVPLAELQVEFTKLNILFEKNRSQIQNHKFDTP